MEKGWHFQIMLEIVGIKKQKQKIISDLCLTVVTKIDPKWVITLHVSPKTIK